MVWAVGLSQGDVWDAQKDILCDTLGALCSSGLFLWRVRRGSLYWVSKVNGILVLNPETDAPTAIWMRSRMKHQWIWDIVGVALIMSVISAIIGLLWLCAIGIRNLESRYLWAGTPRAIPLIDGTNLPIRDFKWDELRLSDVADFCCECNYMPGEEWKSPIGTWPSRSSFVEGCQGKVFRED